jgi:uncharacterized protein
MKLWIDADACPGAIKEIVIRAALKRNVTTIFVANKDIALPPASQLSKIRVGLGPDVVDQYIVEHCSSEDMVISQDIPLAAILVEKGVAVISPYGTLFDTTNIGEKLGNRNFSQDLRDFGMTTGGPKPFGDKEKKLFSDKFDQTLTRRLRQSTLKNLDADQESTSPKA